MSSHRQPSLFQSAARRFPREHGAWVMMVVPMLLAVGAAGRLTAPGLILAASAIGAFMARSPALALLQVRGRGRREVPPAHDLLLAGLYLAVVAASGLYLVVGWGRWLLVWFAGGTMAGIGLYTVAYWLRWDRAFGWQMVFIVGLTQAGPALYVAETGSLAAEGLAVWALAVAYFAAGLLYVHLRLRELKESRAAVASRWRLVMVIGSLTAAAATAGALGLAPPWTALALIPALGRALYLSAVPRYSKTTLKAIGREELWMAVAFTALGLVAFFLTSTGW